MAALYPLKIVSPDSIVFEADVESLMVPGAEGFLGILAHHAPLLTTLAQGTVTICVPDNITHEFEVNGGILEVSGSGTVILADEIEAAQ